MSVLASLAAPGISDLMLRESLAASPTKGQYSQSLAHIRRHTLHLLLSYPGVATCGVQVVATKCCRTSPKANEDISREDISRRHYCLMDRAEDGNSLNE